MATMEKSRRLAAVLVECVREYPGHKRGFYIEKLSEMATIILDGKTWPTVDRLFDHAFQVARKAGQIRHENNLWFAGTVPSCPHCKRPWPEAPPA